jgi:DNA-binding transcriptional MerR regulator
MTGIAIGRLAAATATNVQTIRYYEQIGLLRPAGRTAGRHRVYGPEERRRLRFIRHARDLGFSVEAIRELLALSDSPHDSCEPADRIAQRQLEDVGERIRKLRALERELKRMLDQCRHSRVSDCRIMEVLKDHRHCAAEH